MFQSDRLAHAAARALGQSNDALQSTAAFLENLAEDLPGLRDALLSDFADPGFADAACARLHETSTHFVWRLSSESDTSTTASTWINEYKADRANGYASTIHDHRYDFVTLIMSGGYDYVLYDVDDAGRVAELDTGRAREGDVLVVRHADFHRLDRVLSNTLSFLIKLPPAKNFSTSIDPESGELKRHYSSDVRLSGLVETIRKVGQ